MNNDTNTTNNFAELPADLAEPRYMTLLREAGHLPPLSKANDPEAAPGEFGNYNWDIAEAELREDLAKGRTGQISRKRRSRRY